MRIALSIWRQHDPRVAGGFIRYQLDDVSAEMTLLEALDRLNGRPHGPLPGTTTCQVPLRAFREGATIRLEPMKTGVFSVVRDLVVDRGALDGVVRAGGYVSVRAGSAPEANTMPVRRDVAARALDAATCIGCGACVAACPNGSASLFVGAKLAHLGLLPQGQPERARRVRALVAAADVEGFGACTLHGECEAACPKGIDLGVIARMNREHLTAALHGGGSAGARVVHHDSIAGSARRARTGDR